MTAPSKQTLLERLAALKTQQTALNAEVLKAEAALIEALERDGNKTVTAQGSLTGTLVKGSNISIDAEALKKALGATTWKKVTTQVLDKERLEAHIVTGDVDRNVVAACSTEKDKKAYIKVSGTLPNAAPISAPGKVTTKNSSGGTKPAAKKRVVRPKK